MEIVSSLHIPDDLAAALALVGEDPARSALESLGLDAYRERRITGYQLCVLLDFGSRFELDGFLRQHRIEKYTAEDFEQDLATIRRVGEDQEAERRL
jgi:hypothetical protein